MANTDLVFRMYDCFAKGDMDTIRNAIFHRDITWKMPGHHPLSGEMKGVDQVIAFFGALFQAGITVDNAHFGELDNGTVIEKHTGHGEVNGEKFIFPTATSYGIRDGKIYDVQVHTADQHGVDRYMWAQFKLKDIPQRLAGSPDSASRNGASTNGVGGFRVTEDLVKNAYAALASGNKEEIRKYWADSMVWQVPGHNRLSGWYHGLDEFLAFMGQVGELSENSFKMDSITIALNDEYSADVTQNRAHRAGDDEKKLDIEVVHVLRWKDGKIVAGKGAIFGDGTTDYDYFWSRA